jgi:hypothetical protein
MKKLLGNLFSQPNVEDVDIQKKPKQEPKPEETPKVIQLPAKIEKFNPNSISKDQERFSTFISTDKPIYK